MKLQIKSIGVKVSLLYMLLAIFNMSFFSMIIYENQIDLITENTKLNAEKLTSTIASSIERLSGELGEKTIFKTRNREDVIREISNVLSKKTKDFIIYTQIGEVLHRSNNNTKITKDDIQNSIKAVANKDFTGRDFYSIINEDTYEISFYIPFTMYMLDKTTLYLKFNMGDISEKLTDLYRLVILIIFIIAIFHVFFAFVLFRIFVKPIQSLHNSSNMITEGDLDARSDIKQEDEIGALGKAFNSMADSIQEKITSLQLQKDQMDFELDIAGGVQKIIYPSLEEDSRFRYAVFHKSFAEVSGDYFDIFDLGPSKHGFLLVDVSGHGVPAALITMIAKHTFKLNTPLFENPSDLFCHINTELSELLTMYESYVSIYFSSFYFTIDNDNVINYCNAGHLTPFLVRANKKTISKLDTDGFLVGISGDMNDMYETKGTRVEPGDKIILYTDGITEAANSENEEFGADRLIDVIKRNFTESGENIRDAVLEDLGNYTDIEKLKDDATLFIIEIK